MSPVSVIKTGNEMSLVCEMESSHTRSHPHAAEKEPSTLGLKSFTAAFQFRCDQASGQESGSKTSHWEHLLFNHSFKELKTFVSSSVASACDK